MIADRAVDGNLEIMSVTLNTDPSPFAYWSYQMPATYPVNTLFKVNYGISAAAAYDTYNLYAGNDPQPSNNALCGEAVNLSGFFQCPAGTEASYVGAERTDQN